AVASPAPAHSLAAPTEELPVDMERLLEFTDGSAENLQELVTLYLDQTSEQLHQLETALTADSAPDVRRLAHSCAGASATCGMRRLVPVLRELERQALEGKLVNPAKLLQQAQNEFARIRSFLASYLAKSSELLSKP
ncbi:MAG TPA: Hpt domain-containing protein, partial [Candidatus Sulfotelmatobacter sp.]|nr:Hpt domain-containing protein [Candidatus Sulfotelmatobacter sp.]